jgi:hypothetical protein
MRDSRWSWEVVGNRGGSKGEAIFRAEYIARHGRGAKILKRQAFTSQSRNITNDFVANWPAFWFRHCDSEARHGEPQVYIDILLL